MSASSRWLEIQTRPAADLDEMAEQNALFAVVDACDAPEVPAMWQARGEARAASLYSSVAEKQYATFAPYLFQVDADVLAWLRRVLWQTPWGVFVFAPGQSLEDVRRHFRQFLLVQDAQGEEMYFRFYDPRVLRKYLPTCTPMELSQFYGSIKAFLIAEPDDASWVHSIARIQYAPRSTSDTVSAMPRVAQPFPIREEQMAVFEQTAYEDWVHGIAREVRSKYAGRLPATHEDLLKSVMAWIADARVWGFSTDSEIRRYVGSYAQTQGQHEPIETRLQTYLQIYHENLLGGVDVQEFARSATQFASQHRSSTRMKEWHGCP